MGADIQIPDAFIQAIKEAMESAGNNVLMHEDLMQQYEASQNENNPELGPAIAAYMEGIQWEVSASGETVSCKRTFPDDEVANVLEEGTHPVLGGSNGVVHHLNGGTSQSKVPEKFWGTDASWLAIQPMMIKDNISKLDNTLVPQAGSEAASSNASLLTPEIAKLISSVLGGAT